MLKSGKAGWTDSCSSFRGTVTVDQKRQRLVCTCTLYILDVVYTSCEYVREVCVKRKICKVTSFFIDVPMVCFFNQLYFQQMCVCVCIYCEDALSE